MDYNVESKKKEVKNAKKNTNKNGNKNENKFCSEDNSPKNVNPTDNLESGSTVPDSLFTVTIALPHKEEEEEKILDLLNVMFSERLSEINMYPNYEKLLDSNTSTFYHHLFHVYKIKNMTLTEIDSLHILHNKLGISVSMEIFSKIVDINTKIKTKARTDLIEGKMMTANLTLTNFVPDRVELFQIFFEKEKFGEILVKKIVENVLFYDIENEEKHEQEIKIENNYHSNNKIENDTHSNDNYNDTANDDRYDFIIETNNGTDNNIKNYNNDNNNSNNINDNNNNSNSNNTNNGFSELLGFGIKIKDSPLGLRLINSYRYSDKKQILKIKKDFEFTLDKYGKRVYEGMEVNVSTAMSGWTNVITGTYGETYKYSLPKGSVQAVAVHTGEESLYGVNHFVLLLNENKGYKKKLRGMASGTTLLPPGGLWICLALSCINIDITNIKKYENDKIKIKNCENSEISKSDDLKTKLQEEINKKRAEKCTGKNNKKSSLDKNVKKMKDLSDFDFSDCEDIHNYLKYLCTVPLMKDDFLIESVNFIFEKWIN